MRKTSLVLTAIIVLMFLPSCGQDKIKPKLPVGEKIEDIPDFVMEGFVLTNTDKGRRKWEIHAKGAQIFDRKKKAYAQDVTMKTFEKKGKQSILTGNRAIINTDNNFMEIYENVKLVSSSGMILYTNKLYWDDKKQKVYTDAPVTVIQGKNTLKGIGMESDINMNNLIIRKKVNLKAEDIKSE